MRLLIRAVKLTGFAMSNPVHYFYGAVVVFAGQVNQRYGACGRLQQIGEEHFNWVDFLLRSGFN